jgi:ParB/RepB/Spo0J family partition protein
MQSFNSSSTLEVDIPSDTFINYDSSESPTPQTIEELSQQAQTGEDLAVEPEITSPQSTDSGNSEAGFGNEIEPSANANSFGTVLLLHPDQIRFDKQFHRVGEEFNKGPYKKLALDITETGVNVEPIAVRLIAGQLGEPDALYELISGLRRLHACAAKRLNVLAIVVDSPRSKSFALDRLKSNMLRKNLSPYESGKQMREILEAGEFESDAKLAEAIGASKAKVSRELNLADLPDFVINAFVDPRKLRVLDGPDLAKAVAHNREIVEAEAKAISAEVKRPDEREVVKRLLAAANLASSVARCNNARDLIVSGQVVGNWMATRDDQIQVNLTIPLPPQQHDKVIAKFQKLLVPHVEMKQKKHIDDAPDDHHNDSDDTSQST